MQSWIVGRWHNRLLILLCVGPVGCALVGCTNNTKTLAPVITAEPKWAKYGKLHRSRKYYTVEPGDTLWHIARMTGDRAADLACRNHLSPFDRLYPGQILKLGNGVDEQRLCAAARKKSKHVGVVAEEAETQPAAFDSPKKAATAISTNRGTTRWYWPAQGKVIEHFSATNGGNRGIDITGKHGEAIYSIADGRVVYAGNALSGYGNLLIIKHNEDYLSAYAHNATLLVKEQQLIKAKQKIATMGSSGTHSVRLHFEIRYRGKSVDPMRYLPSRH